MHHLRRSLDTRFYHDPYIESLNRNEHDLFLTILLNPLNNLAGIYEISIAKLAQYSKMTEDEVRLSLQKLQNDKKIMYVDSWIAIKNHIKNQAINDNMTKHVLEILSECPTECKIFVLMGTDGEPEGWLVDFTNKVVSFLTKKEKAKFLNDERNKGIDYRPSEEINNVNIETVVKLIMSNKKQETSKIKPLLKDLEALPKPSGSKKNEEEEEEGRRKKEEEGIFSSPVFRTVTRQEIDSILDLWRNSKPLPDYRRMAHEISTTELALCLDEMKRYSEQEVLEAFENYLTMHRNLETYEPLNYGTPLTFLQSGIGRHINASEPLTAYKKKFIKKIKVEDLPTLPPEYAQETNSHENEDESPWPTDEDYDPDLDERFNDA